MLESPGVAVVPELGHPVHHKADELHMRSVLKKDARRVEWHDEPQHMVQQQRMRMYKTADDNDDGQWVVTTGIERDRVLVPAQRKTLPILITSRARLDDG